MRCKSHSRWRAWRCRGDAAARLAILLGWAIPGAAAAQEVQSGLFSRRDPVLLVFDLQDDHHPRAALVVNKSPDPPSSHVDIILPFKSRALTANERALFRAGYYETWTLITFAGDRSDWPQQISFTPEAQLVADVSAPDNDPGHFVFLVTQGQQRRFIYRYPSQEWLNDHQALDPASPMRFPDAIAVKRPKLARQVAVREGWLTAPEPLRRGEAVFPAFAAKGGERYLEFAYEMPATDWQKLIVAWGLKFLVALSPLVALAFVPKDKIRHRRFQHIAIAVGAALLLAIGLYLAWVAFETESLAEVLPEASLTAITAVVTVIVARIKVKDPVPDGPPPAGVA